MRLLNTTKLLCGTTAVLTEPLVAISKRDATAMTLASLQSSDRPDQQKDQGNEDGAATTA
jgi:hypothetical protein